MKLFRRAKQSSSLMSRFMPYFKGYRLVLSFDLFCAGLTTLCELVLPLIVKELTNAGIDDLASLTIKRILSVTGLYIFLRCIDAAASYYMASGGHVMGSKIETDMRNDLFSHLQGLSFSYYDNTKIGQLMSRLTSDLFEVTEFSHHLPEEIFITIIKIVVGFIIFARMNILLALIVFSVLPVMFFVTKHSRRKMKQAFLEQRYQIGEINAEAEDSLLGIRVVKSFANEKVEKEKFGRSANIFLKIKKRSYRYMGSFHTTVRLFDGVMYIIVVATGAYFMSKGNLTPGDFTASLLMITTLLASIRRIVEFGEQYNRGITGIERFFEVMDVLSETDDDNATVTLENVKGDIEFKSVSFRYEGTTEDVLDDINISIEHGSSVAIVGPSGGGKTTLCNLIPRFYDVISGGIYIDGINIKDITLKSLRSQIGVVQQDVYMFSGSIRQNIAYGKPDCTDEEVWDAAKKAGAHEFIMRLPEGYNTFVGERGVKLSGGQKQRLSIARLFLKNPPILILDEATSSLDNESERLVQLSLEELSKGRTSLVIAHRLSTIRNAEKILVLTEKGIVEQGAHSELLAEGGIYAELYNLSTAVT